MLEPIKQERCYKVVGTAKDWTEAQFLCQHDNPEVGTDLATITSPQENAFVKSLLTTNAWIGPSF